MERTRTLSQDRNDGDHALRSSRIACLAIASRSSVKSPASVSEPIQTSTAAAALLRPCFDGLDREQFLVCGLDAKHRIIGINIVSIGSLTFAIVHPREVFKPLILMNAAAFICAHNHPSSDPTPSQEDRLLTQRLRHGAELLGITLLDHLVLGEATITALPIRAGLTT